MFEDRRNQINGRPPVYAKNNEVRRPGPVASRGWDRSHPLEPLPVERNTMRMQAGSQQRNRARGVSLERGANAFGDGMSDSMRRSKSQYQVDDMPGVAIHTAHTMKMNTQNDSQNLMNGSSNLKPRSMTSLLDDNQNNVNNSKTVPRFGFNQSPVRNPPSQRLQVSSYRYKYNISCCISLLPFLNVNFHYAATMWWITAIKIGSVATLIAVGIKRMHIKWQIRRMTPLGKLRIWRRRPPPPQRKLRAGWSARKRRSKLRLADVKRS